MPMDARYEPSCRGPHAVGVVTEEVVNLRRDGARFAVELWYPAAGAAEAEEKRGAPIAEGGHPLALLSHGFMGHRRQLSHLAAHLASHGHVVACPDHEHMTRDDVTLLALSAAMRGEPYRFEESLRRVIWQHPTELWEIVRAIGDGELAPVLGGVDLERIAVGGFCVGGWVAMKAMTGLPVASALVLVAPVGGHEGGLAGALYAEPVKPWTGVETLSVVAARDTVVPLATAEHLYDRLPGPKRLAVLPHCGHMQLTDGGDESQTWLATDAGARKLVPTHGPAASPDALRPASAHHEVLKALVTAHLDATLRSSAAAGTWLDAQVERRNC